MADGAAREPWSQSDYRAVRKAIRALDRDARRDVNQSLLHGRAVKNSDLAFVTMRNAEMTGWRWDRPISWLAIVGAVIYLAKPVAAAITQQRYGFLVVAMVPIVAMVLLATYAFHQARSSAEANRELLRSLPPSEREAGPSGG